jgi:hypothetical protein
VAVAVVWILVTAAIARHDANRLRGDMRQLQLALERGDEPGATRLAAHITAEASAVHARTSGPAWWAAAQIPYVGRPAAVIRRAARLADEVATGGLPTAVAAGRSLDPAVLRPATDQIDPTALGAATAPIERAHAALAPYLVRASRLGGTGWLSWGGAAPFTTDLRDLEGSLSALATATRVLPTALGADGVRRYFIAFQTEAEARGLGGLPGSYAILRTDDGRLSFERFGADNDLVRARAHVDFGAAYRREYDQAFGPASTYQNSDASPHFPYAAQIWMSMWADEFHERLDGAIATDPQTLGYLLGALGPVVLPDGTTLTQGNAVPYFESQIYRRFADDNRQRKIYEVDAARLISTKVLHTPSGAFTRLAQVMRRAAADRRLAVYSSDPSVESAIENTPLAGEIPVTSRPFLDVIVNDSGANKLDYYLDRAVTYHRSTCAATTATVSVTLQDSAPSAGLPPVVAGRHVPIDRQGTLSSIVSLFTTAGSRVGAVKVDGRSAYLDAERERGHPVTTVDVTLTPGQSKTITYEVHEPAATGPIIALEQPLVRPLRQTVTSPTCGG